MVSNPKCEATGCGEWQPAKIVNPEYKGRWSAPMIDNPVYKGVWKPRRIANPEYFEDTSPALSMAPIKGLALELWTTNAGIHFDNFVISDSLETAFVFADESSIKKLAIEKEIADRASKEAKQK